MKNLSKNKKGFTLIELLAVIVILAILVMLAIPAVTRYLTTARRSTYSDNALRAIEAVRSDVVSAGFSSGTTGISGTTNRACSGGVCAYGPAAINDLLENKFGNSSFGNDYTCLGITVNQSNNTYTMYMVDGGGNGFSGLTADLISQANVGIGKVKIVGNDGKIVDSDSVPACPTVNEKSYSVSGS